MGVLRGMVRIARDRAGSRWRPRSVASALLLAVLGSSAVGLAVRASRADGAGPAVVSPVPPAPRSRSPRPAGPDPETVLGAPCGAVAGWAAWRRCRVAGVAVVVRAVAAGSEDDLYARLAGPPGPGAAGRSECAAGRPEERSWARAAAPARPVGRYRCRIERGRAVLWWSDPSGLVARADAPDGDLARLFAWWTRHAGA